MLKVDWSKNKFLKTLLHINFVFQVDFLQVKKVTLEFNDKY